MPFTIEEGKSQIESLLRKEAAKQDVEIERVQWFPIGKPPRQFSLEAHSTTDALHATEFTLRHLCEWDSDPQMLMQVNQKVVAIVVQLKQYG